MRVPSRIRNSCTGLETPVPSTVIDAPSFEAWFNALSAASANLNIGEISITDNLGVWDIIQSKHGCSVSYYDNAQWFEPVCMLEPPAPPPNPSGVMAGELRVGGVNGNQLIDFVPDANNCSPAVYYAIIARSDNQLILAQTMANNPATIKTWLLNQSVSLPVLINDIYYAAVYGECLPSNSTPPSNPVLSVGNDWNTIAWPQLNAVKFQGSSNQLANKQ